MKTGSRVKQKAAASAPPPTVIAWVGVFRPTSLTLYLLLAVALGTGLSIVRMTHANRIAFNELQELRDQANELDVTWGQLLLEQSTFGVEGRIEQKAVEQLKMQVPDISSIVMVSND